MWNRAKGVGQVQENDMEVSSIPFCALNLVPYHAQVLHTAGKTWHPCFLHRCVNEVVHFQVGGQPASHYTEEEFTFYVQETDLAKLTNVSGVFFLWD